MSFTHLPFFQDLSRCMTHSRLSLNTVRQFTQEFAGVMSPSQYQKVNLFAYLKAWDHSETVELELLIRLVSLSAHQTSKPPHSWQNNVPKSKHMVPGTKDQGPGTRDKGPWTRDQGPGTKDLGPGPRDQGPEAKGRPKGRLGGCLGNTWGPAWSKRILKAKQAN